ncbi:MAG: hypothetical protein H6853_04910 [Rhodospirillales bacterium]|nr:hypothetical protein [Alphaproteobacteria bacterium]USO02893.1 MAG: hypothetical protein H6853_04910 [Rhodospirillales bacterium]
MTDQPQIEIDDEPISKKDLLGITGLLSMVWFFGALLMVMAYFALTTGRIQIKYDAYTYYADSPMSFMIQVGLMFALGLPALGISIYGMARALRQYAKQR